MAYSQFNTEIVVDHTFTEKPTSWVDTGVTLPSLTEYDWYIFTILSENPDRPSLWVNGLSFAELTPEVAGAGWGTQDGYLQIIFGAYLARTEDNHLLVGGPGLAGNERFVLRRVLGPESPEDKQGQRGIRISELPRVPTNEIDDNDILLLTNEENGVDKSQGMTIAQLKTLVPNADRANVVGALSDVSNSTYTNLITGGALDYVYTVLIQGAIAPEGDKIFTKSEQFRFQDIPTTETLIELRRGHGYYLKRDGSTIKTKLTPGSFAPGNLIVAWRLI